MKVWNNLIKYRIIMYLSSNKYIVPMVIYFIFTYNAYNGRPQSFVPDATVSALMTGYIMLWISFSFFESEDSVSERILYCNIQQNKVRYYGSKIVTLLLISAILSLIGAVYPFFVNALNGFKLFDRPILFVDFCCIWL